MSLLQRLRDAGALRTLDHAFAQSLRRLDPATPDEVLAAAALASLAVASGHAGFDPSEPWRLVEADIAWPAPGAWRDALAASRWVAHPDDADAASAEDVPLVLEGAADATGLLYLRRYREYERRLVAGLRRIGRSGIDAAIVADPSRARAEPGEAESKRRAGRRSRHDDAPAAAVGAGIRGRLGPADAEVAGTRAPSAAPASPGSLAALAPLFRELFPGAHIGEDHQARAAAIALRHALVLVTGGPGTGKTTAIARLLVLLAAQALHAGRPLPRVALAAPTGRAAERMAESVRNAVQALAAHGVDPALLAALPSAGTTLHRLLGTIPDASRFRHDADNPLPFDAVVVDEASMIDLPLMAKLVEAVADGARLVLLGDPDQLPSVEAGDVLSGILRAAGPGTRTDPEDAEALRPLLGPVPGPAAATPENGNFRHPGASRKRSATVHGAGHPVALPLFPDTPPAARPAFPARRIHLTRGYRQSDALDLAPLAAAVRAGDAATALALLRGGTLSGVHFHDGLEDPLQAHRDALLAHWRALSAAATPADALARATLLRLLTAVRDGPQGARTLNARIEALLSEGSGHGPRHRAGRHFHGQLLIVTENSYRHRLFNGDTGLCFDDGQGSLMAWFPGDDPSRPRAFHPAALPAHDSAFAMTVHKAQGSEFDTVWLLLPARSNRVLSRELVYTGLTRARRELHVAAGEAGIRDALGRHASRWSGLGWRLGDR